MGAMIDIENDNKEKDLENNNYAIPEQSEQSKNQQEDDDINFEAQSLIQLN